MLILFLIMVALCMVLLSVIRKNKITLIFGIYMIAIVVLIFASLTYYTKLMTYPYYSQIDNIINQFLIRVKLNVSDISRIYNFGITIIFTLFLSLAYIVMKPKLGYIFVGFLPIIYYVWLNDPYTSYKCYMYISEPTSFPQYRIISMLVQNSYVFNLVALVFYGVLPFVCLAVYFFKTKLAVKKSYAVSTALSLAIIDGYCIYAFIFGPFNIAYPSNLDYFKFPKELAVMTDDGVAFLLTMFVILMLFLIIIYAKPFDNLSIVSAGTMRKNSKIMNKNFTMMFHVYKNLFFAIEKLAAQGKKSVVSNPVRAENTFGTIMQISEESITTISRLLELLRDIKVKNEYINIIDCIENAVALSAIPESYKLTKNYEKNEFYICADKLHITEALVNLLNNAVEAIELKKILTDEPFIPKIEITVDDEIDFVIVNLCDNGCGIEKKNIKNIFNPFFSTKQSNKNWGVGLSYVKKVFNLYKGHINVRSEHLKYTRFDILIPQINERLRIKHEKDKIVYM